TFVQVLREPGDGFLKAIIHSASGHERTISKDHAASRTLCVPAECDVIDDLVLDCFEASEFPVVTPVDEEQLTVGRYGTGIGPDFHETEGKPSEVSQREQGQDKPF